MRGLLCYHDYRKEDIAEALLGRLELPEVGMLLSV